jgi:hypothetical protein
MPYQMIQREHRYIFPKIRAANKIAAICLFQFTKPTYIRDRVTTEFDEIIPNEIYRIIYTYLFDVYPFSGIDMAAYYHTDYNNLYLQCQYSSLSWMPKQWYPTSITRGNEHIQSKMWHFYYNNKDQDDIKRDWEIDNVDICEFFTRKSTLFPNINRVEPLMLQVKPPTLTFRMADYDIIHDECEKQNIDPDPIITRHINNHKYWENIARQTECTFLCIFTNPDIAWFYCYLNQLGHNTGPYETFKTTWNRNLIILPANN